MIAKCSCQHCGGGLEFESDNLTPENDKIVCPHCECETQLVYEGEALMQQLAQLSLDDQRAMLGDTSIPIAIRRKLFMSTSEQRLAKMGEDIKAGEVALKNLAVSKINSNGDTLEMREGSIVIFRRGIANMLAAGMNGERSIAISTITAIQLKLGGTFSPGYILFSYAGSKPFMGGLIEATQDPDAFIFNKEFNDRVAAFKRRVEEMMAESRSANNHPSSPSLTEELARLVVLRSSGVLSDQEFEAAKRKLLS